MFEASGGPDAIDFASTQIREADRSVGPWETQNDQLLWADAHLDRLPLFIATLNDDVRSGTS